MIKESFINVGKMIASKGAVQAIKLREARPEILVVGGVALLIAGGVYACVQTPKAAKVIEEHNEKAEKLKVYAENNDNEKLYSEKEYRKDLAKTYLKTGAKLAKVYSGPMIVAALGAGSVLYGHNILRKEHAEVLAAYGTLQTAYDEYRSRVRKMYGDDIDEKIFRGESDEEVTFDNGDGKIETKKVKRVNPVGDPYTFIFEEVTAPALWTPVASTNRMNVVAIQAECNRMLEANGYLFLNDVLRMLGMKETEISRKVGWIAHKAGEPYTVGDNDGFVDFGLFRTKPYDVGGRYEFLNGDEPNFLLHFNVQGVIIDKFEAASRRAI